MIEHDAASLSFDTKLLHRRAGHLTETPGRIRRLSCRPAFTRRFKQQVNGTTQCIQLGSTASHQFLITTTGNDCFQSLE